MKFLKSLFASSNLFTLNSAAAKSFTEGWPQIKNYYEILSKNFNASETGNLQLLRSDAENLVDKADALSIEGMPAEFRNPKTLETLLTLKKQTKLVGDLVLKQKSDQEIKAALNRLYEIFHSMVEICLS